MILNEIEIMERVARSRNEREPFIKRARRWEKMWKLEYWAKTQADAHAEGKEQVTMPTPLNVVHLSERFRRDIPEITCPPGGPEDTEESRQARQRYLTACWQQNDRNQKKKVMAHAWWLSLVRSRFVFKVRLVDENLPKRIRKRALPFTITAVDPIECGFQHGELYTEWAYHEYDEDAVNLHQLYPEFDFKNAAEKKREREGRLKYQAENNGQLPPAHWRLDMSLVDDPQSYTVTEFWYMSEGMPHMALLIDGTMAIEPTPQPRYDDIPLIEVLGDDFPIRDEEHKSYSILRSIEETWAAENRLVSQIATGQLWHFWPQVIVEGDEVVDTTRIGPGHEPMQVGMGTKMHLLSPQANLQISDRLLSVYEGATAQSSYPPTLYGSTTGGTHSGLEAIIHQNAARGRIKKFVDNFQMGMEVVNELLLCFADNTGSKGITIKGNHAYKDSNGEEFYAITITPEDIQGEYDNEVNIEPEVPAETTAQDTLAARLYETGLSSAETTRNNMSWQFPVDEQQRIYEQRMEEAIRQATAQAQAMVIQAVGQVQAQQIAMQAAPQQPGMPGAGGPASPSPQQSFQADSMIDGQTSPEYEGQLTPEQMGMDSPAFMDLMNSQGTGQALQNLDPTRPNNGRPT